MALVLLTERQSCIPVQLSTLSDPQISAAVGILKLPQAPLLQLKQIRLLERDAALPALLADKVEAAAKPPLKRTPPASHENRTGSGGQ